MPFLQRAWAGYWLFPQKETGRLGVAIGWVLCREELKQCRGRDPKALSEVLDVACRDQQYLGACWKCGTQTCRFGEGIEQEPSSQVH